MIGKKSRYANAKLFSESDRGDAFAGIRPRNIVDAQGVLEYIIKEGDRLDLLALNFYNDSSRWWRILDANPQIIYGGDLRLKSSVGETILIPRSKDVGGDS